MRRGCLVWGVLVFVGVWFLWGGCVKGRHPESRLLTKLSTLGRRLACLRAGIRRHGEPSRGPGPAAQVHDVPNPEGASFLLHLPDGGIRGGVPATSGL